MSKEAKQKIKKLLVIISNGSQNSTSSSILAYHPLPPRGKLKRK